MYKINIKPLSINEAYQGRRFKNKKHRDYEEELFFLLPNELRVPKNKPLILDVVFGLSSKLADLDNFIKVFIDVMQKKYNFNDKWIYTIIANKAIIPKGQEFIHFLLMEK